MQYILTEEEYKNLENETKYEKESMKDVLMDLCSRVANSELVAFSYDRKVIPEEKRTPWHCNVIVDPITGEYVSQKYCDLCPVRKVCPCDHKQWSK
jgi:hypothetical protein